ncbi:MAG TPA: alpha-hydroxy acid oxidase [Chloroflexota bacterium]|nr:alpha-hydroxy acid oxidase [Chloroflexota bacterium]
MTAEAMEGLPDGSAPLNLIEIEEMARALLPPAHYGYLAGGSGDEVTLRGNREAFHNWRIVPRVLRGVDAIDLTTSILGINLKMPILLSPVAFQRLAHEEGEVASARAARDAGTIFTLSTLATRSIEDVGAATDRWWFQLYCYRDREVTLDLLSRAEAAGAMAIVITVDTPLLGRREADERNSFALPTHMEMANLTGGAARRFSARPGESAFAAYVSNLWDPSLSWQDVDWVAARTNLPLLIKGILSPADARLALEHGGKAIVVSNHGGRQLDSAVASLDALETIAAMVQGSCPLLLDGGVRRGTDIIKALALGASAVMIGRPYVWGLALGGQAGVQLVLRLLRAELKLDLLLCGAGRPADVDRGLLIRQY